MLGEEKQLHFKVHNSTNLHMFWTVIYMEESLKFLFIVFVNSRKLGLNYLQFEDLEFAS